MSPLILTAGVFCVSASALRVENQSYDQSAQVDQHQTVVRGTGNTHPYKPSTSPKMSIKTMPTNILDCCIYVRTPVSPTMPIA
jgi:hypothetical protein